MSDWTIRTAVSEDEDCIASMWLRQLCHGNDAVALGAKGARVAGSASQIAYWEQHQPIVTPLIRRATVRVACDAERATYEAGLPAVIWGWAVVTDDTVFGVGIKRAVARVGLGSELAKDLLGDLLDRPMRTVLELVDLSRLKLIPPSWHRERGWASSLRQLSERVIASDELYRAIAMHIIDPTRPRWTPNERRAA